MSLHDQARQIKNYGRLMFFSLILPKGKAETHLYFVWFSHLKQATLFFPIFLNNHIFV